MSWDVVPHGYAAAGALAGSGQLWADRAKPEFTPTYCVYRTRVVCAIYHIGAAGLAGTKGWPDIPEVRIPVDHLSLVHDRDGLTISLYYLSRAQLQTIRPPYEYHY